MFQVLGDDHPLGRAGSILMGSSLTNAASLHNGCIVVSDLKEGLRNLIDGKLRTSDLNFSSHQETTLPLHNCLQDSFEGGD